MQGKLVTASGLGLYQARTNKDSSFTIDTLGRKSNDFDVIITGPPDAVPPYEAVPLRCYQQKDGNLLAEFQTVTVGTHKIEVLENGRLIHGSPFMCHSFSPEEVFISDTQMPKEGYLPGKPIQFKVDRRHAGLSDLEVVVTSPLGEDLPVEVKGLTGEESVDLVEFRPDVTGRYKFVIRYGGIEVPQSPISFVVKEEDLEREKKSRQGMRFVGAGLQKAEVTNVRKVSE